MPATLSLTVIGHGVLAAVSDRTGKSKSDVVEQLLRRFGHLVEFPDDDETNKDHDREGHHTGGRRAGV